MSARADPEGIGQGGVAVGQFAIHVGRRELQHVAPAMRQCDRQVDVLADGRFAVTLYYAVSKADVGATIELSRGETRLKATISRPHEVPVRGGEHDRVPRRESYVKDFRPLTMGVIELPRGRGELVLAAKEIPGSQAMEFRLLMLRRVRPATPCE